GRGGGSAVHGHRSLAPGHGHREPRHVGHRQLPRDPRRPPDARGRGLLPREGAGPQSRGGGGGGSPEPAARSRGPSGLSGESPAAAGGRGGPSRISIRRFLRRPSSVSFDSRGRYSE